MAKKPLRSSPLKLLSRFPFAPWAPIPLRLIVGYGFMNHGFAKLARAPTHSPSLCWVALTTGDRGLVRRRRTAAMIYQAR